MSKIGKINISIPEKVKVVLAGNIINIEGPLGKKSINVDLDMFNLDIIDYKVTAEKNKSKLEINLKYNSGNPVIQVIERISKPGRRIFSSAESLPKINNGLGIAIVSTPKGVMSDIDARKQKIGGEIICKVF